MDTAGKDLGREGAYKIMTGRFYVEVLQVMLLFGSNMWFLNPRLEESLEGFHHQEERKMAGMGPKHQRDRMWV